MGSTQEWHTMTKILIVDDEADHVELIRFHLEKNNFPVLTAMDGESALIDIRNLRPDLVVLDWMLPKMEGIDVCKKVRQDPTLSQTPIIMLSAKSEEFDKVLALELGADDYVSKPFSPRELVARIKAILRRSSGSVETLAKKEDHLNLGALSIDATTYEVRLEDKPLPLTKTEFDLLLTLARHPQRVFTREQLLYKVWGDDFYGDNRVVDVHIRRLRGKLEAVTEFEYVRTVRGVGYKFVSA